MDQQKKHGHGKNGVFFLVYMKDVSNPRNITPYVCGHVYGGYHMGKHNFSVIEILQLEEKERLGLGRHTR